MNENDLITLNAYIDEELDSNERILFERRLEADPYLKGEMESFRRTKLILAQAERVPLPRSFQLDKAAFRPKRGFLSTFLSGSGSQWVAAAFSMAAAFIMMGSGLFLRFSSPLSGARNAAMAPEMAQIASEADTMEDGVAEPMAAMEAPAEEAAPFNVPTPSPEGAVVLGMGAESSEPAESPTSGMGGGPEGGESSLPPMPLGTAPSSLMSDPEAMASETFDDSARIAGEIEADSTDAKSPVAISWRGISSTLLLASGGIIMLLSSIVLARIPRDR